MLTSIAIRLDCRYRLDCIPLSHQRFGRREVVESESPASTINGTAKHEITNIPHASCGVHTATIMHGRRDRRWIYGTSALGGTRPPDKAMPVHEIATIAINIDTLKSDAPSMQCSFRRECTCTYGIGILRRRHRVSQIPLRDCPAVNNFSYSCFKNLSSVPAYSIHRLKHNSQDVALQQARHHRSRPQGQARPHASRRSLPNINTNPHNLRSAYQCQSQSIRVLSSQIPCLGPGNQHITNVPY